MDFTPEKILAISDEWVQDIRTHTGATIFNFSNDQHRLTTHGVIFHELNFECLIASIIATCKTLALPANASSRMPNIVVLHNDHKCLWGWCCEYVKYLRMFSKSDFIDNINHVFYTCSEAAVIACQNPRVGVSMLDRYFSKSLEHLTYLSFPLLECVLRKYCREYVDSDGVILKPFLKYAVSTNESKPNRCNNLGDLLELAMLISTDDIRYALEMLNDIVRDFSGNKDASYEIYKWRNSTLHGSEKYISIAGLVFSYSLVIIMFQIKKHYDENLEDFIWHLKHYSSRSDSSEVLYNI